MSDNFRQRFREALIAAEGGSPHDQLKLARMYAKGFPHAPHQSFDEAERWILEAHAHPTEDFLDLPENPLFLLYEDSEGIRRSILSGDAITPIPRSHSAG